MKKLIILFLLLPSLCSAGMIIQTVAAGGGSVTCPTGYASADISWDGDSETDTNACDSDGAAVSGTQTNGSITSGNDGNEYRFTANGQHVLWTVPAFDSEKGTLWVDVYWDTVTADTTLIEIAYDNENYVALIVRDNDGLRILYRGDNTTQMVTNTGLSTDATWRRIGISWDNSGADASHDLAIVYDSYNWVANVEELNDRTAPEFTTDPTTLSAGHNLSVDGNSFSSEDLRVDNIYYISGSYKAAHPTGENL